MPNNRPYTDPQANKGKTIPAGNSALAAKAVKKNLTTK